MNSNCVCSRKPSNCHTYWQWQRRRPACKSGRPLNICTFRVVYTTYLGDNENQWFFDELEITGTDGYAGNVIPVKPGWRYPWRCRERVVCGLRRWWRWWSRSWCFCCCFLPLLSLWKWATRCLCVREFGFCFLLGFSFIVFRFRREELSVWWFRRLQLGLVVVVVVVVVTSKKERKGSK